MINKIILTLLLLAIPLVASEIQWAKDYKAGIKEATKLNKPVLFVSSRHSCKWCVVLDDTTFKNAKVIEALNRDYISIISYSDENDYMPRELYRPGTPSLWFLKSNGEPMFQPLAGAIDAENFLKALAIVKTEFDKNRGKK